MPLPPKFDARLYDYQIRNDMPIRIALDRHTVRVTEMRLVGEGTQLDVSGTVGLHDHHLSAGSPLDLLNPYALLGGIAFTLLCAAHGAFFLTLKTRDDVLARARRAAKLLAPPAAAAAIAFLAWTLVDATDLGAVAVVATVLGAGALVGAAILPSRRSGLAFALLGSAFALMIVTLFSDLYPNVLISSIDPAFNLTLGNAASGHYTLEVMTGVAAVFVPVVVLAQGWTYWIFRRRIGREELAVDRVHRRELAHIGQKNRRLEDLRQRAAGGLQHAFQVRQHLAGLCADVALDQRPLRCQWDLAGAEDQVIDRDRLCVRRDRDLRFERITVGCHHIPVAVEME